MSFFSRLGRAFSRVWHDIPTQDQAIIRLIARSEAQAAINKATKTPLGTVAGAIVESQLPQAAHPQADAVAQVNTALQGGHS